MYTSTMWWNIFIFLESDGSYEAYAFKCSDNMMGVFRCKAGTSKWHFDSDKIKNNVEYVQMSNMK